MSVSHQPPATRPKPSAEPGDRLYRLSITQYHEMARAGILKEDAPIELLDGLLVTKMTRSDLHIATVRKGFRLLDRALPPGWFVVKEDPIVVPRLSEPEPDLAVIRGEIDDYLDHKPGPKDVALVVEVSVSSYLEDRGRKWTIYARAAIPYYWIVNLNENRVEVYSEPAGKGQRASYRTVQHFGRDDMIPLVIEGSDVARIAVRELIPSDKA